VWEKVATYAVYYMQNAICKEDTSSETGGILIPAHELITRDIFYFRHKFLELISNDPILHSTS